jgi:hypothetical protein
MSDAAVPPATPGDDAEYWDGTGAGRQPNVHSAHTKSQTRNTAEKHQQLILVLVCVLLAVSVAVLLLHRSRSASSARKLRDAEREVRLAMRRAQTQEKGFFQCSPTLAGKPQHRRKKTGPAVQQRHKDPFPTAAAAATILYHFIGRIENFAADQPVCWLADCGVDAGALEAKRQLEEGEAAADKRTSAGVDGRALDIMPFVQLDGGFGQHRTLHVSRHPPAPRPRSLPAELSFLEQYDEAEADSRLEGRGPLADHTADAASRSSGIKPSGVHGPTGAYMEL